MNHNKAGLESEMSTTTTKTEAANPMSIRLPSGQTVVPKSNISIEADEIPVIDISPIFSNSLEARQAVAEKIREASHRIGFFYAVNHGIDPKYAAAAFEQGAQFFKLPLEEKMKVDTNLIENEYVGYHSMTGYNRNNRKHADLSEAFNWAYDPEYDPELSAEERPGAPPSISMWPSSPAGFKEDMSAFHSQMLTLARRLTRIFALALHLPESYFDSFIKLPEAGMRVLHYPEQIHSVDEQLGIGAHT